MSKPPELPLNRPSVQVTLGIDSTVPLTVASQIPVDPNNEHQLSLYEIIVDEVWLIGFEEFLYDAAQLIEPPTSPWELPPIAEAINPNVLPFGFEPLGYGTFG